MPRYRLKWSSQAERAYKRLPDRLKQEVIDALKEIQEVGLEGAAEQLDRELKDRYKYKFDGWRIIMKVNDNIVTVLDIRPRNRNTYLNVP
jgi:mRNA-degrading endonuclease RelE of RelBE toxin-antitoxin system